MTAAEFLDPDDGPIEDDQPAASLHLRRGEAAQWLDIVFGDRRGHVAMAFGFDPHRTPEGRYAHGRWVERSYPWPADRDRLLAEVAELMAAMDSGDTVVDVYATPHLRASAGRRGPTNPRGSNALPVVALHADMDGPAADGELYELLASLRTASGTAGHEHGIVPLAEPVTDRARAAQLQRALRDRLGGGVDDKIADNDLIRLPGTMNAKPMAPASGQPGPPLPVAPLAWSGRVWSIGELAAVLGVDLDQPPPPLPVADGGMADAPQTVPAPTNLPERLRRAVDGFAGASDKSGAWHQLVCLAAAFGYSRDESFALAVEHALPHVGRYAPRALVEFDRSWGKAQAYRADRPDRDRRRPALHPVPAGTAGAAEPAGERPDGAGEQATAAGGRKPRSRAGAGGDAFTDARLAETIADDVLDGRFVWCPHIGWLEWDGRRWAETVSDAVTEAVRLHVLDRYADAVQRAKSDHDTGMAAAAGWRSMTSARRIGAVLSLARGIVRRDAAEFDADPDLLNTPSGIVDLRTGDIRPHDPAALLTKITIGCYRPGYRHPDWDAALTALPEPERLWLQARCGQAATGRPASDGVIPVLCGGGENGKSLIVGSGVMLALGDYADAASTKLLLVGKGEHSTEIADLRGQRMVLAEELAEGGRLDMAAIKRITDTPRLKARRIRCDPFSFPATHSMMITTNYLPSVTEADRGTWRRLALLLYPFTFRKPGEDCSGEFDRPGDPQLKARIEGNADGQADAAVTWVVEGALGVAADPNRLVPTPKILADTARWRGQSDLLVGMWTALLDADPDACVLRSDLYAAYVDYVRPRNVRPLSEREFAEQFPQHDVVRGAGVKAGRPRHPTGLSLRSGTERPEAAQVRVWHGVRFRPVEPAGDVSDAGHAEPQADSGRVADQQE